MGWLGKKQPLGEGGLAEFCLQPYWWEMGDLFFTILVI